MRTQFTSIFKTFFHEKLFRRRVELDITQEEMADRLVMASRTYVDLKTGDGSPRQGTVLCLDGSD